MKNILLVMILVLSMAAASFVGCKKDSDKKVETAPKITYDVESALGGSDTTSEAPTDEPTDVTEPTTEEVTVEPQPTESVTETEPPAPVEEETTASEYVGAWTLLSVEPLNPAQTGYAELDNLVASVIANCTTADMNGYQKVWACYLWMVDNITYSRGMDANTGAYSTSDPATTPTEVLWATDLLNSSMGCCYNYSSAFAFIMKALGYDAHLVTGSVPKYGGGTTPHCWLYVNLGGKPYTFDPDLDMNFFNRGENPDKNIWFCIPKENVDYFYKEPVEHNI